MTERSAPPDRGLASLAWLGLHEPRPARDARVRSRCHAVLHETRRREAVRGDPGWRFAVGFALGPAVVGTLCAMYLFEVLSRAIHLYRF